MYFAALWLVGCFAYGPIGAIAVLDNPLVCLNMIVKNEAHVINRALDSAALHVDRTVIVDTGSTDGTLAILHRRQRLGDSVATATWSDFGTNREHALTVARDSGCEFVFFLDADDTVEFDADFEWPPVEHLRSVAWANVDVLYGTIRYDRKALINTAANCHWHDVLHEYMACTTPSGQLDPNVLQLKGVRIRVHSGGARSRDPDKYLKDAALLEAELAKNPQHSRYAFYLAQSYRDAGRPEQALKAYERRANMSVGFAHEVYEALLEAALLHIKLKHDRDDIDAAFQAAYRFDIKRWEAVYYWADYYRTLASGPNYVMCYALTQLQDIVYISERTLPPGLFLRQWIYAYGLSDIRSVCGFYAGHVSRSYTAAQFALSQAEQAGYVDTATLARLRANVGFITQHTK
jgi:glycosyltransferase involved in cell wall biosynthesis